MSNAIPALTKTCRKCDQTKPLDDFFRSKQGVLGRHSQCKVCFRAYYDQWYAKNRERVLEKQRQHHAADPTYNRSKAKAWREANPERVREQQRKAKKRRRQREREAAVAVVDYEAIWVAQRGRCAWCGELIDPFASGPDPLSRSTDHIIPLSKGGLTTQENTQFLHLRCNSLKAATLPDQLEESA